MKTNTYIESGIDILHHITDVGFMFGDKLENFPVLDVKWPVSQLFNVTFPYFINS